MSGGRAGRCEISRDLAAGLPELVFDRDEMKRVFINIIENAMQAMPGGGALTVEVGAPGGGGFRGSAWRGTGRGAGARLSGEGRQPFRLRRRGCGTSSRSAFADTGGGISADNARRLFEPNFSTKSHGTGLGLAISKGTLDAYGGEILIESSEGVGTCVRVRLPVEEAATQRPRPQRRGSRRRRRPRRG